MKSVSSNYFPSSQNYRCCNTGHPVLADPLTGKSVCSCQLQAGVPAYLSRVPGLPETLYSQSAPKLSTGSSVSEQNASAFYSTHAIEKHRSSLTMHSPTLHPYYMDHVVPTHPYGSLYSGFDINGARRKTTNREATGPLKAWLYQHRKNPYPTKGEKVMLAIISQMTLTQVSTWFANARRRLKKEAKMDDKGGLDLTDIDVNDTSIQNDSFCSRFSDSDSESAVKVSISDISDISDNEEQTIRDESANKMCMQRLLSPDGRTETYLERHSSPGSLSPPALSVKEPLVVNNDIDEDVDNTSSKETNVEADKTDRDLTNIKQDVQPFQRPQNKSKIWSIAQIIG